MRAAFHAGDEEALFIGTLAQKFGGFALRRALARDAPAG